VVPSGVGRSFKRLVDLTFASAALFLLCPLFLSIAVLVRLDSVGPVFVRSLRLGVNGRTFRMLRFRTMVSDYFAHRHAIQAGISDTNIFKIKSDPRITRVGRYLRKFSLDQLPELFNVVRGEMSLVGPQPRLASDEWGRGPEADLQIPPGMTGIWRFGWRWQSSAAEMTAIEDWYADRWSPWLDFRLLAFSILPPALAERSHTLASARRYARIAAERERLDKVAHVQRSEFEEDLSQDSFEGLYKLYANDVLRYVNSLVRDPEAANEIAAETFTRVARNLARIDRSEIPLSVFVLRSARSAALDYLRNKKSMAPTALETRSHSISRLDDLSYTDERQEALRAAISHLPEGQREVLVLRHIVGLRDDDIAATLGRPMPFIKDLQREAREALLTRLKVDEHAIEELLDPR
jgi:RNA polymerase sigma factor (sigma-70 family)